jgi:hypothetical protein
LNDEPGIDREIGGSISGSVSRNGKSSKVHPACKKISVGEFLVSKDVVEKYVVDEGMGRVK